MKQSSLDSFFNITYKNKENLNKTLIKNERTSIFNAKTPNNTPNYSSIDTDKLTDKLSETINAFKLNDNLPKYILRFDGASKGNPGKCGAGSVIYYNNKEIWNGSVYLGTQTNNYAEYYGMIIGLKEAIKRNIKEIYVEGDSDLVIKQMLGKYSVKSDNLKSLFKEAKKLQLQFNYINFNHIYRNKNQRADELANIGVNNTK